MICVTKVTNFNRKHEFPERRTVNPAAEIPKSNRKGELKDLLALFLVLQGFVAAYFFLITRLNGIFGLVSLGAALCLVGAASYYLVRKLASAFD